MKHQARPRIVAFRLTEEDYEVVKALSSVRRRRVSDFARDALLTVAYGAGSRGVESKLASLEQKIDQLFCTLLTK